MLSWSPNARPVILARKFIRSNDGATTGDLVEWDDRHGRKLFEWNDAKGAAENRLDQARKFFNRFRLKIGEYRIREFANVRTATGRRYIPIEKVNAQPELREMIVEGLTNRMRSIAMELRFWE